MGERLYAAVHVVPYGLRNLKIKCRNEEAKKHGISHSPVENFTHSHVIIDWTFAAEWKTFHDVCSSLPNKKRKIDVLEFTGLFLKKKINIQSSHSTIKIQYWLLKYVLI